MTLVGSLDTKGSEYAFVRDRLAAAGLATRLIDTGILAEPTVAPDVSSAEVARAGGANLTALREQAIRNDAVEAMAAGAASLVALLHQDGLVSGVVVLGGSNAGFVMSRVAAALTIGCPKLLVSTVVAGDTRPYVGTSDLMMMYPVVDIAGLNSVSTPVLAKAADAVVGMLTGPPMPSHLTRRMSVGATMFGVTTGCVAAVQDGLAERDTEVQVFHCTGTGGATLETMIEAGMFDAVADITTTELADELLGGVCTAGPHRLEAAARRGTPQVVSTGALDMVNFGPRDTVPPEFSNRMLFAHNPSVTLMRTNADENAQLGRIMAEKLNAATGFVEVHVPERGFSQISVAGGPFHDPEADNALVEALGRHLDPAIPLHVHDHAVNDSGFVERLLAALDRALHHARKVPAAHELTR